MMLWTALCGIATADGPTSAEPAPAPRSAGDLWTSAPTELGDEVLVDRAALGPTFYEQTPLDGFVSPHEPPMEEYAELATPYPTDNCQPRWRMLPDGLIYRNYLAGAKESRIRGVYSYEKDRGYLWDVSLGGKVSILRYGTGGEQRPEGFEIQLEGAGLLRLDPEANMDVEATDYRIGAPLVWGNRVYQMKFGYYHLSSHLGDEFLLRHPNYDRLNYSRDVIVWGHSYYATRRLRFYAEAGWAFASEIAKPWEFQFGIDYSPYFATGTRGAPFFAFNGQLREEVDFGGAFVAQAGWAWRGSPASGLLRFGVDYYNGKSDQFSFYDHHENKVGMAVWYDY